MRCSGEFSIVDAILHFSITYRSPALSGNHNSSSQLFLYLTITEHPEKGMAFDACRVVEQRGTPECARKEVQRSSCSFNLEEEIGEGGMVKS